MSQKMTALVAALTLCALCSFSGCKGGDQEPTAAQETGKQAAEQIQKPIVQAEQAAKAQEQSHEATKEAAQPVSGKKKMELEGC